jgi:hypothetical protein
MPEEKDVRADIESMFAVINNTAPEAIEEAVRSEGGNKEQEEPGNAGATVDTREEQQEENLPEEKEEEGSLEEDESVSGDGEESTEKEEKAALMDAIQQLKEEIALLKEESKKGKEKEKEPEKPKEYSFVTEEDFDSVINTSDGFNKALSTVFNAAQETFLSNVPAIVARVVDERVAASNAASRYIADNRDLFEDYIPAGSDADKIKQERWEWLQKQVSSIQAEQPELSNDPYKLLCKAGDNMRRLIGRPKKDKKEQQPTQRKRTPFPTKAGSRAVVPEKKEEAVDKIKNDITEMMKVIQP